MSAVTTKSEVISQIVDLADVDGITVTRAAVELGITDESIVSRARALSRELTENVISKYSVSPEVTFESGTESGSDTKTVLRKKANRKATGKRVKIFGHSCTAILRWYGAEDFTLEEAALGVLTLSGVDPADNTVKIQHKAGRTMDGSRGPIPELSKSEEKQLREAVL